MLNGAEDQGSNPRLRFKVIFRPGFESLLNVSIYVLLLDQPPLPECRLGSDQIHNDVLRDLLFSGVGLFQFSHTAKVMPLTPRCTPAKYADCPSLNKKGAPTTLLLSSSLPSASAVREEGA